MRGCSKLYCTSYNSRSGNASITTSGPASGSLFPIGTTTVTFTLKDGNGNTLSSCSFTVTVNDTQNPLITCSGNQSLNNNPGQCGASYSVVPTATDNCTGTVVTGSRSDGLALSALYPIGTTVITWTATDAAGNTTTCSQNIVVTDNEFPVVSCPANITVNNDPGTCGAIISINTPAATDNCGTPVVTSVRSDGAGMAAAYPIGSTTITWKATDASGNVSSCTQTVVVTDNQDPVLTCNPNIIVKTDAGLCSATVGVVAPNATDNCGTPAVSGTRSDNLPLSAAYPKGVTLIVWKATDASGRTVTCSQSVTVKDEEKPSITAPANITLTAPKGSCGATVALGSAVTSDNCGVASTTNNAPSTFPVGTTSVVWTVTDVNGNTNTATQTVTVTDTEKPVITGQTTPFKFCNSGSGNYTINSITVTDNCGINQVTYSITGATVRSGTGTDASGLFNTGTSTINWTATDTHGNSATWTTTVIVGNAIVVTIPDAYALSAGTVANTVYIGYSPAGSIKLKANASGGTGTLTYQWSTGATTQTITVSPVVNTTYTVTVSDASGCSKVMSRLVMVSDIRCGTGKVSVCIKTGNSQTPQTCCISTSLVSTYILLGAKLGSCSTIPAVVTSISKENKVEAAPVEMIGLSAFPNPSRAAFTLQAKGIEAGKKAELRIYTSLGKLVEVRTVTAGQVLSIGSNYIPGLYIVEIREGKKTASIKLVKQPN